jgi:hypothetical protein
VSSSHPTEEDGLIHLKHKDDWGLKVKNLRPKPIYMAVFNFTASWQVFNMVSEAGDGDFIVIPPAADSGEEEIELTMEVPQHLLEGGQHHCEDIIKVFIMDKETSFPAMILPPLSTTGLDSGGQVRSMNDSMLQLLHSLVHQTRNVGHNDWTTRNFLIRTTYHPEAKVN